MSWRCSHCGHERPTHIDDRGALICPPEDEPTDKDDE